MRRSIRLFHRICLFAALASVGVATPACHERARTVDPEPARPAAQAGVYEITLSTHDSTMAAPTMHPDAVQEVVPVRAYRIEPTSLGYDAVTELDGVVTRKPIDAATVEALVGRVLALCPGNHSAHDDPWIRVTGAKTWTALGGLGSGDPSAPDAGGCDGGFAAVHAELLAAIESALAAP